MEKREYFIDTDFKVFLEDNAWGKKLSSKIDFKNANKYKTKGSIYPNRTFLNVLISNFVIDGKASLNEVIKKLEEVQYPFSLKDFKPAGGYSSFPDEAGPKWIEVFDMATQKGLSVKRMKKPVVTFFQWTQNENIISYIEKNIAPIEYENIKHLWRNLGYDDDLDSIKQMGFNASSLLKPKDIAEEKERMNLKTQRVLSFIEKANPEQLEGLLNASAPSSKRIDSYIHKNKLEISMFSTFDYEKEMTPKPRSWFTENQLKVIDVLEAKTNQVLLEKTPSNAKERFKEIKEATGEDFESSLILQMRDGTEHRLPGLRKK
jgi:hypothetical protein